MAKMHNEVHKRRTKARDAAVLAHKRQTEIQPVNFTLGDFVLVAVKKGSTSH